MAISADAFEAEQLDADRRISMVGMFVIYCLGAFSGGVWTALAFWVFF